MDGLEEHVASNFRVEELAKQENQRESSWQSGLIFRPDFFLGLFFGPEVGGDIFFRNVV
jgi:hypothetical protein